MQSVKCIVYRRVVFSWNQRSQYQQFARALSELRLGSLSLPWALGGYLVGTWWSLLAAVPHRTISSLAIRQIVDRARTSEHYVGPSPLSISSPSFIFFLIFRPSLCFHHLLPWTDDPLFSFSLSLFLSPSFSLFLIRIDDSRIKKGAHEIDR